MHAWNAAHACRTSTNTIKAAAHPIAQFSRETRELRGLEDGAAVDIS